MDEVININVNKTKKETKDITKMVNGSIKKNGKANHHSESVAKIISALCDISFSGRASSIFMLDKAVFI